MIGYWTHLDSSTSTFPLSVINSSTPERTISLPLPKNKRMLYCNITEALICLYSSVSFTSTM